MTVTASFPMVLLPGLGCSRAKTRKSLIVVEGWCRLRVLLALLVAAARAGTRPEITGVYVLEPRGRSDTKGRCENRDRVRRPGPQRREVGIVLDLDVCR